MFLLAVALVAATAPAAGPTRAMLLAASSGAAGDEVFRVDARVDGAIIAVSTAAIEIPSLLEDRIIRLRCPCDPSEVNRFDRRAIGLSSEAAARASDVSLWLAVIGPPVIALVSRGWSQALLEDFVVFAETLAVNSALVTTAKHFVWQRPIPRTYAGEAAYLRKPGGYRSFWSGHTSTVTAAMTDVAWTLRLRDGERGWPWVVAAAMSVSVAVERVAGGHHFPSDVLVGLFAGALVGTAVPLLHTDRGSAAASLAAARGGLAFRGRF